MSVQSQALYLHPCTIRGMVLAMVLSAQKQGAKYRFRVPRFCRVVSRWVCVIRAPYTRTGRMVGSCPPSPVTVPP
jgi:hypothetical protein